MIAKIDNYFSVHDGDEDFFLEKEE